MDLISLIIVVALVIACVRYKSDPASSYYSNVTGDMPHEENR